MKLLRSLSMIITLALILTVGGVYAVWTYIQNDNIADISPDILIDMGDVTFSGSSGIYSIDTSALSILVEPTQIGNQTHYTSLVATGVLVIKFTPNADATQYVKDNGVATSFDFALSNAATWTYAGQQIFTINTSAAKASGDIALANDAVATEKWTKQADGTLTYTITAEEILQVFQIAKFQLDTKAKYDAFSDVLSDGNFRIHITDGVV